MRKPTGTVKEQMYDNKLTRKKTAQLVKQLYHAETARQRILHLIFHDPLREFSLSEIAEYAKVSKSTASWIIDKLDEEGFLILSKRRLVWSIRGNYEDPAFRHEKILYNLAIIFRSSLADYLTEVFGHPKTIILFGSFSKGEDLPDSDIDIAIEHQSAESAEILRLKELENLESQIGRRISIHLFNRKTVDLNLFNNIANGIVLAGFLEVRK